MVKLFVHDLILFFLISCIWVHTLSNQFEFSKLKYIMLRNPRNGTWLIFMALYFCTVCAITKLPYSLRLLPRGLLGARTVDSPIHHWAFNFKSGLAPWHTAPTRFEPTTGPLIFFIWFSSLANSTNEVWTHDLWIVSPALYRFGTSGGINPEWYIIQLDSQDIH